MDESLIGFWRVRSFSMAEGKVYTLLAGGEGEIIEFTRGGEYVAWGDPRRPMRYHYRTFIENGFPALDNWIEGLEPLATRCIYRVDGTTLEVCIVGKEGGSRPTKFKRDDRRLWCLMYLDRSDPPPRRKPATPKKLLEPGKLIPTYLLDPPKVRKTK